MTQPKLSGCKVAVLATNGFEQSELREPKRLLEQAGAKVDVISPAGVKQIKGWSKKDWGDSVEVDVALEAARSGDYDALVLPGGVMNPDLLRLEPAAIALIRSFGGAGGLVKGRKVTSWSSLRKDLENASAHWEDSEVVVDGQLITSRKPDDIPAFVNAIIAALGVSVDSP